MITARMWILASGVELEVVAKGDVTPADFGNASGPLAICRPATDAEVSIEEIVVVQRTKMLADDFAERFGEDELERLKEAMHEAAADMPHRGDR